ncbi:hypothetical protein JCM16358_06560 [Halanaerocella petrolearia]
MFSSIREKLSIKQKITVRAKLLIMILIPFLVAVAWMVDNSQDLVVDNISSYVEDNGLNQVNNDSKMINNWLEAKRNELQVIARSLKLKEGWSSSDSLVWQQVRRANQLSGDSFTSLMLVNKNGQAWLSKANKKYDFSDEPEFKKIKDKSKMVVTDPFYSELSKKYMVLMALPVKDGNNQVIGYLAGNILLDKINKLVHSFKMG